MNKKIIIGIVAVVLLVVAVGFFVFQEEETLTQIDEESVERKLLIVGESWPPFSFEEEGIVKGIHVEILGLALEKVGVPYEVRIMPWTRALKMVETGEAEVLLSGSYTDERDKWAYFTENQRLAGNEFIPESYIDALDMVFFIRKIYEGVLVFDSFEQIRESKYRVGLDASYAYEDVIFEAGWNTKYYNNVNENLLALAEGEVEMYLQDELVGLEAIKNLGLQDDLTYIDKPVFTYVYHAPFSKSSDYPQLKEIWEQVVVELEEIQKSGVVVEIYTKYLE